MAPLCYRCSYRPQSLTWLAVTGIGLSCVIVPAAHANPFGTAAAVSDEELGSLRGGFELPNGMDVTVGVQIDTRVNGDLALRTVLNIADPAESSLRVYAAPVQQGSSPANANPPPAQPASVNLPTVSAPQVSVNVSGDSAGIGGPTLLPILQGDQVQTALGTVQVERGGSGTVVVLKGPSLEVQHVTGGGTGVLIANTMNNRAIDTVATVNISLSNSAVPIGNVLLRVENVVLDAVGGTAY